MVVCNSTNHTKAILHSIPYIRASALRTGAHINFSNTIMQGMLFVNYKNLFFL